MNRVTISDVAKAAGVSMKSVSRVINREPNVSDKLRVKVQAAIDALGYVPDLAARSLAGARAFTIGVLLDNPSPNYTMKIVTGAYQACRKHGYHLLLENLESARNDIAEQAADMLRNARIDGFVLTPPITDCEPVLAVLEAQGIPYVRIAPTSFQGRSPALAIDDCSAASELARHFWGLGHRRFGLVTGPPEHGAAGTRRAGFKAQIAELGGSIVAEEYGGFQFETGIGAGLTLLAREDRPSAIFAMNDDSAAGVMSAAAQLGLRVPGDVAVAGFDDSWIAQSVWPNLTTIYQPITELAFEATELLIERGSSEQGNGVRLLDYRLIERGSTVAP
ncbi:MAG: LacI family DNA-binding transcriptional regulator [Novosphingobium sp.]|nr:LacI family DNA-binding transcriptional regulator [Novosphingobium sp.]